MNKLLYAFVAALLASTFPDTSAQALNARSWVSSTGTGSTCTRALPCAAFATAHDATIAGGTIHCVDGNDYTVGGTSFLITKSLTIDCAGTQAIHGGQNNIDVNGAGIVVHLRNLLIDGGNGGSVGVKFINGNALYIENCTISGWFTGIQFAPPSGVTAKLVVLDSTIVDNGNGVVGSGGIFIQPTGSGVARVSIDRTKIVGNTYGIYADGTLGSGLVTALIKDSYIANSTVNGVSLVTTASAAQISITMDHSASVGNGGDGILSQGSKAFAVLTESTVIGNFGTGLHSVSGGNIYSYRNNATTGNVTEGGPNNFFSLN